MRALTHLAGSFIRAAWEKAFRWGAISSGTRAAARFGSFGTGSIIAFPTTTLLNERFIHIGDDVAVGPYVALSAGIADGQELILPETLVIGDRTVIGRGSAIAAHYEVKIGDDVWLAPDCFVCDQSHDWTDVDTPIGRQFGPAASVSIGDGTWLGHGVIVLPGVTIGRHVAVGAGSIVTTDLPDRSVAVGAPARVVREHDPLHGWVRAQSAAPRPRVV